MNLTDELVSLISHVKNRQEFNDLRRPGSEYSLAGFDRLKCIYIHIPKSAGISINRSLFGNIGGGHKTATQYKKIFGPYTFRKYFKFSFVRNPYSRLLSAFLFLKKGGFNERNKEWFENNVKQFDTFEDFVTGWVTTENIFSYYHFLPQYYFLYDKRIMNIMVDYIGKVENIEEDFDFVCHRLGVKRQLMSLNQTSGGIDWKSYYNDHTMKIVSGVYKLDFDLFNYSHEIT